MELETPPQILAWHGDPELKAEALMRMKNHQAQDQFMQGLYFATHSDDLGVAQFKGCFHGCLTAEKYMEQNQLTPDQMRLMLRSMDSEGGWFHEKGERMWGIPQELGQILDITFESFPDNETAGMFAVESIEAMAVGADLTNVTGAFIDAEEDAFEAAPGDPFDSTWGDQNYRARQLLKLLREAPVPNQEV